VGLCAKTCNISETVQDKTKLGYYDGLMGSRIHAFDWYQNQWPWMTLNGRNVTLAGKSFTKPTRKKLIEDRPILSAAKCRPMILYCSKFARDQAIIALYWSTQTMQTIFIVLHISIIVSLDKINHTTCVYKTLIVFEPVLMITSDVIKNQDQNVKTLILTFWSCFHHCYHRKNGAMPL